MVWILQDIWDGNKNGIAEKCEDGIDGIDGIAPEKNHLKSEDGIDGIDGIAGKKTSVRCEGGIDGIDGIAEKKKSNPVRVLCKEMKPCPRGIWGH